MELTFYGGVPLLAGIGYLGLVWLHRPSGQAERPPLASRWSQILLLAVIGLHGASLLPNWFHHQGLQFGFAISISWTFWLAVLLLWIESWFQRMPPITRGVFLLAAVSAVLPLFFPGKVLTSSVDGVFRVHLLLAMLAYSTFTISAATALVMLAMEKALHQTRNFSIDRPGWWQGLPPLIGLDQMLVRVVFFGFVLVSFTLISGMAVGLERGYGLLRLDHKTVFTIAAWALSLTLILGHRWWGWRGKVAARWTLAGFVALLLAYVGSSFVLEVLLKR
jgi:ABC-type uncharacterized transport system permease subunit